MRDAGIDYESDRWERERLKMDHERSSATMAGWAFRLSFIGLVLLVPWSW